MAFTAVNASRSKSDYAYLGSLGKINKAILDICQTTQLLKHSYFFANDNVGKVIKSQLSLL
jgi:hypothetical protein